MTTPTNLPPAWEHMDSDGDKTHDFNFTGKASELWPIIFKNLLFNILTLSLYRFWGRTNVRRYIWENTRFKGDPLEYTGRGGELFVGFLIVLVAVFLPLVSILTWAQMMMQRGDLTGMVVFFVTYMVMLWLLPFGLYRAFKYRMSRTRWRGIRGAQLESGARYATEAFSYGILSGLTLGLLIPMMDNKLYSLEANNRRFGSGVFSYKAGSGPLYSGFFKSVGIIILGMILLFVLMSGTMTMLFQDMGQQGSSNARGMAGAMYVPILLMYIGMIVFYGLAFSIYAIAKLTHFWNNTKFQTAEFKFSGTLGGLIKLFLGNILITIFTLGIAYPIAQMRVVRFMAENLKLEGSLNLAAITQTDEEEPSFGEGLAEGFDMGTI